MQAIGISDQNLRKINSIMYRFIWNSKINNEKKVTEKVKRETVNKSYSEGGLNMIDIVKLQHSFLLKWADRLLSDKNESWMTFPKFFLNKVGGISALSSSVIGSKFKGLELIGSCFWRKVLILWLDYKNTDDEQKEIDLNINSPIFNNTSVLYKNKTLFNARCIQKNIICIKDFIVNNDFMNLQDFFSQYGETANTVLVYNAIFNAIKSQREDIQRKLQEGREFQNILYFKDLAAGDISRKSFYEIIKIKEIVPLKESWCEEYSIDKNDENIWLMAFEACAETKLLELQWKILHSIFPTGTLLKKMKIKESELCDFCAEEDSLAHFFLSCSLVQQVWAEAEQIISVFLDKTFLFTNKIKLFGLTRIDSGFTTEHRKYINMINLVVKKTISIYKQSRSGNINLLFHFQLSVRGLS